jgi:hypothetical protein
MIENIYLAGAINTRSQEDQDKQVKLFADKGWELKNGPSTHVVKVSIPAERVRDFCDWLQAQPQDQKVERFTTRSGEEVERRYVSFYLDGNERSSTWVKLSKTIKQEPLF